MAMSYTYRNVSIRTIRTVTQRRAKGYRWFILDCLSNAVLARGVADTATDLRDQARAARAAVIATLTQNHPQP